ncbi:S-layer homology domain-containing protein [Sinanaerobacter chloroacetimidivorans]|jgi:hypothetical protein|uniref:S-layer homology domain-containing protein n=1 Tax=Sinanaerobacter chloroacetimidivorans TaxID=2818044 RepID=A0A8J7W005_9FIRM|nr:S-layer homology domain-containing protein [Sinanaerobacter chloroacetimidivorans]MBR0596745.1 S-layer homology domain-containing protein [Sinanaerobacter chloroacetimidivorans]
MTHRKSRKLTAGILAGSLLAGTFLTGFTYQAGMGNVYYQTKTEIYENAYYSEQLAGHSANGIERAYIVTADTRNSDLIPYVFEGEVTGNYTMDTMVSTLQSQGYKVVAGINGDLYDTATGTPKGLTIHDGKIKTSGYAPEYVISFDDEGAVSLAKASLGYSLKGTINVPTTVTNPVDPTQVPSTTDGSVTTQVVNVPTEYNANIGFFNVPHGGAKALHLFNRQYASTTKTSGKTVEVILEAGTAENAELTVGGTITATVVEVRTNSCNTPIGQSQLVLSTVADSTCASQLTQLIPGSTVEISVNDYSGGALTNSKEALGVYYVLYDNGQYISNGTNINPRTIIGIKPDGTMMLYVLDGRQPGFSAGLGLTDAAKHLVSLGCTTVVNMDGGGSSVMSVREAGLEAKAAMKNSPSGGTQRKTTNGLLLVYKDSGNGKAEHLHIYPSQPLAMPGADIQLSTYASDSQYEPASLRNSVSYSMESGSDGSVNASGLFTAGSSIGTATIQAESGGISSTVGIDVYDNITFTTNVQNLVIDPGKSSDINVTAKYGYAPIASKDSLFTWSCDPMIGTIDTNGLFKATGQTGVTGNIYVEYKQLKTTIPVQVGATSIDFLDTKNHWAKDYIGKLAARGIVNGMGNNYFMPDESLTRAQFLTMLAKTVYGLDVTKSTPAGFADVNSSDWYYNYVNWGFENGIVKGLDETAFAPNANITREQMAIMLSNFTNSIGLALPQTNVGATFTDSGLISPWASESVSVIVASGIMGGYPEGNYLPQGQATRAQAATVIYKYCNIRDNIAINNK